MSVSDEQMQALINHAERREQSARRTALLLAAVPLAAALIFIGVTVWNTLRVQQELAVKDQQLATADTVLQETVKKYQSVIAEMNNNPSQAVAAVQSQLDDTRAELAQANTALDQTSRQLEQSKTQLDQSTAQLDQANQKLDENNRAIAALQTDLKNTQNDAGLLQAQVRQASRLRPARDYNEWQGWLKENLPALFEQYANDRDAVALSEHLLATLDRYFRALPPYALRGSNEKEGFNSASFAAQVLVEVGRAPAPPAPLLDPDALRRYLLDNGLQERSSRQIKTGDLIFYNDGSVMFYFPDAQGRPFTLGMTAAGLRALSPDFAQIEEIIAILP